MQDYAIVPVAKDEWEYLINPATMRLLGAMGCLGILPPPVLLPPATAALSPPSVNPFDASRVTSLLVTAFRPPDSPCPVHDRFATTAPCAILGLSHCRARHRTRLHAYVMRVRSGPRTAQGHAFWRIAADALRDDAKTAATLDELMSAQSAEIEEEVVPRADDSEDEEERPRTVDAPESPAREEASRGEERAESAAQDRSEPSPPTRAKKRRIRLQDSSDEEEEPPAKDLQEEEAAPEDGAMRRKRAVLEDSDDGEDGADAAGEGGGSGGVGSVGGSPARASATTVASKGAAGVMRTKRARLAAHDSDSE